MMYKSGLHIPDDKCWSKFLIFDQRESINEFVEIIRKQTLFLFISIDLGKNPKRGFGFCPL